MSKLGADFDATQPSGGSPRNQGDDQIRDIKARLKDWAAVMFDLETGMMKNVQVTSAMMTLTGVTAGTYRSVQVDVAGRVISGTNPTTLSGYGITDALGTGTIIGFAQGGLAVSLATAANGFIPIGNGAGMVLAALSAGQDISITNGAGTITIAHNPAARKFTARAVLTSAAGAAGVELLPDASVGAGKKVLLEGFIMTVDGAVVWATSTNVKVQDSGDTPTDFITIAVAALTANAVLYPGTANVTPEPAYKRGTGGAAGKGLVVVADADGTGSNLIVTAWGSIINV